MRAMAASAGARMEGDACCFERGYRSVQPVYSGGYFGEGFTGQQYYGSSENSEPSFNIMSNQTFERYEMPIAETDFPGNNSEQRTPPTANDMDCHNPPETATADSCTREQEYFQRLAELNAYQVLIEEAKEVLPKNALDEYIRDFLSGNRKELELSRLFRQNPVPRPLCGVFSSTSDHISSKKAKKAHRIMDKQKNELRTILESQKPSDFGINARKWTMMNVTKLINNLFQLDFEQGNTKNLLCRMKISLKSINDSHKLTPGR
ncbi:hypothetical protein [Salinisphaera sp. G21_0]|uniref:hypothetical protein n=1 Tax=Salinisphaera sp. G21_0 TaxID=2821094 RepID=UPI001ADB0346|nr:hypothetical protein [Salinisphaera sp. G21_0]MBO9483661.1 hypothetical protein [Salinisphaera sp. G21_0]